MNTIIAEIKNASTEQLKREWGIWAKSDSEEDWPDECVYHYEQIHAELNRRKLGAYCTV